MNPPRLRRNTHRIRRTARAKAAFIATGTLAALAAAGLAVAMLIGTIPPAVAVLMAGALAAWVYAMVRFVDLAATSDPLSVGCHDGTHDRCLICSCACHQVR